MAEKVTREKHTIDAQDKVLGRLASEIAQILTGKKKPEYLPYMDMGDSVEVTNANGIRVTGNKMNFKDYYRHSNYPGGLKTKKMKEFPKSELLKMAVYNMLPKNKLRNDRMKRLKIS